MAKVVLVGVGDPYLEVVVHEVDLVVSFLLELVACLVVHLVNLEVLLVVGVQVEVVVQEDL